MRKVMFAAVVMAVLAGVFVPQAGADQFFTTGQKVRANAIYDWSFLTAWDSTTANCGFFRLVQWRDGVELDDGVSLALVRPVRL